MDDSDFGVSLAMPDFIKTEAIRRTIQTQFSDIIYSASVNKNGATKTAHWETVMNEDFVKSATFRRVLQSYLFMIDNPIFKLFPLELSEKGIILANELILDPKAVEVGTRKVPGREMSFRRRRREYAFTYTGAGAEVDYGALTRPGGMAEFDTKVSLIKSSIIATMLHHILQSFHQTIPSHALPMHSYGYNEVPDTVEKLIAIERDTWGALNKAPQAIHYLIGKHSRIIENRQANKVGTLIMSSDCQHFINHMDRTNLVVN